MGSACYSDQERRSLSKTGAQVSKNQVLRLVEDKATVARRTALELWPERQRAMHSLHYVLGYYASFRPELPNHFVQRYSRKGDIVLDPFCGRGTTALEANLLGRIAYSSDRNPLASVITSAKTFPVGLDEVVLRLNEIDFSRPVDLSDYQSGLAAFYHPNTFRELLHLKSFLSNKRDRVNRFIELLAISRLHGHTSGYFSVYTAPQRALTPSRQLQMNLRRRETPEYRAVVPRIIRRAAQVLQDGFSRDFFQAASKNVVQTADARNLSYVPSQSVDLVLGAPPLPDSYCYEHEQWLENWFLDARPRGELYRGADLAYWRDFLGSSLREMLRVLKPDAHAVLAVGELEGTSGSVFLEDVLAAEAERCEYMGRRFRVEEVFIHQQRLSDRAQRSEPLEGNLVAANNRIVVLRVVSRSRPRR